MKICFLASGNLGYNVLQEVNAEHDVTVVLTDRLSVDVINFCLANDIPHYAGNPRGGKAAHLMNDIEVDLLVSVNYLFLLDQELIGWPKRYAINFHGSLLPKYRGRTPHVWAIINNETQTGITAHLIDEGCDTGAIIDQLIVPIDATDTGATILDKYNALYPAFVKGVLKKVIRGEFTLKEQDHTKATYFGKRTPEDGRINWEWQKERIYNWVRAQAHPYPGAFTFYEGTPITVNRITFCEEGFIDSTPNGTILNVKDGAPVIKTPNGAVQLVERSEPPSLIYQPGKIFL